MAHTSAHGVKEFVHRQNGMAQLDGASDAQPLNRKPSNKGLHDDLKVSTPGRRKSQSNTHAVRNGEAGGRVKSLRSHSGNGNRPPSRSGIFSTDASNADRTSASGSTQQAKTGKSRKRTVPAEPQKANEDDNGNSEYETDTDYDEEGNHLPRHPVNQGHPQAQNAQVLNNGLANRRMTGDSYPSTTAGEPSEVDVNDVPEHSRVHARGIQGPPAGMLIRGGAGAPRGALVGGMTAPRAATQPEMHAPPLGTQDLVEGFTFAKAAGAQLNVSRNFPGGPQPTQPPVPRPAHPAQLPQPSHGQHHQMSNQHLPQAQAPQQRPPVNAQPAVKPSAAEKSTFMQAPVKIAASQEFRQPLADVSNQYAEPDTRRFPQSPDPDTERRARKSRTTTPNQQPAQSDLPQRSDNQYSEFDYRNGADGQDYDGMDEQQQYLQDQHPEQQPEDQHFEEQHPEDRDPGADMDYFGPELHKMSYGDIKAQSFDLDPHGKPFDFLQELQANNLEDKLVSVMGMKAQPGRHPPQAEFFQSMTAAEWEDSGDWFLERFGDLIGKLKNARKEKRKFARDFENEIEARHDAVTKKQKLTERALGEMKESGGKVLEGTPKKKKKSTKTKK